MISAPIPHHDSKRIETLKEFQILDTEKDPTFDGITELASRITQAPIALVSLVDQNRQWFKSRLGLNATETPRDISFCGHAILKNEVMVIEDALKDQRFADNPLVLGEPHVRFYAGAPLIAKNGHAIGTLCVIDHQPKTLTDCQKVSLQTLANQVVSLLDLRLANARLEEEKSLISTLTESMAEGVVYQDASGKIIEFNQSACHLLGLTPDQLLGRTSFDPRWKSIQESGNEFLGSEHPAMVSLRTGKPIRNVIMGVCLPEKTIRWIRINSTPIYKNGNQNPTHVLSTFTDLTEEKNLLSAVRASEEKFKSIFEHAQIGMIEAGPKQTILESNKFFADMLGYTTEEMKDKKIVDITHPDDLALSQLRLDQLSTKAGTTYKRFKKKYLTKTGGFVWGQVTSKSFPINKQGEVHMYSVIEDITEVVKLEESMKDQEAKLAQASKMSALGEMAAGMAHEINNPLAIIGASAAMMRRQIENIETTPLNIASILEKLVRIESTVERIAKIVRGLRSIARNSDQDPKIEVLFSQLIDDTLSLCREKFKYSSIDLRVHVPAELKIKCRPTQISQVLLNLLNNSFDAIHQQKKPWIEINAEVGQKSALITLTDSGNGIPAEIQPKLMLPFFTTKEVGKGTGLGLSISQGIIAEHGGNFYYDAKHPNTRFVIELPVYEK